MLPKGRARTILGIPFFAGSAQEAVDIGCSGGLVVVPAAPALVDLPNDPAYRDALLGADLVITDSGLMVLMWRLLKWEKIKRVSGLKYLRLLLRKPFLRESGAVFWVMPSIAARDRNIVWLREQGFAATTEDTHVAPIYPKGTINDPELLSILKTRHPSQIIVGLGGGTQERLGLYLRNALDYRPGIHCIGAAIGFLNGDQVNIPTWADRLYLGWLFRCISEPSKFLPRYWSAKSLIWMLVKYKHHLPQAEAQ